MLFPSNLVLNEGIRKVKVSFCPTDVRIPMIYGFSLGFYIAKVVFSIKNANFAPKEDHNSGLKENTRRVNVHFCSADYLNSNDINFSLIFT